MTGLLLAVALLGVLIVLLAWAMARVERHVYMRREHDRQIDHYLRETGHEPTPSGPLFSFDWREHDASR